MNYKEKKTLYLAAAAITLLFTVAAISIVFMPRLTISLHGEDTTDWECGTIYQDAGAQATMTGFLKDRTPEVLVNGSVDWRTPGVYLITYRAKYGPFRASAVRTVTVADTTPPALTLLGDAEISIVEVLGTYTEPGWTAVDTVDGDLSGSVQVSGQVDTSQPDTYTLTYTAEDSSGNSSQAIRTVTVLPLQQADSSQNAGKKIVYLTFDDGPGPYTRELLDILAKYNVKATFFVTNSKYRDLIAQEATEGHTVGIHSATHNYRAIYASGSAYFQDLQAMQNVIVAQTGQESKLIRFPGGSSNTVSRFNRGIMTRLAKEVQTHGYQYVDWNVVSGDAGDTTETDTVYQNVITGIQKRNVSVVLQHDIKKFSVDAVEDIIRWGLLNGYTFLPMDENSPIMHHHINN